MDVSPGMLQSEEIEELRWQIRELYEWANDQGPHTDGEPYIVSKLIELWPWLTDSEGE